MLPLQGLRLILHVQLITVLICVAVADCAGLSGVLVIRRAAHHWTSSCSWEHQHTTEAITTPARWCCWSHCRESVLIALLVGAPHCAMCVPTPAVPSSSLLCCAAPPGSGREEGDGTAKAAARPRKEPKGEGRRSGKGRGTDGTPRAATAGEVPDALTSKGASPSGEERPGGPSPGAPGDVTGKKRRRSSSGAEASAGVSAGGGAAPVADAGVASAEVSGASRATPWISESADSAGHNSIVVHNNMPGGQPILLVRV